MGQRILDPHNFFSTSRPVQGLHQVSLGLLFHRQILMLIRRSQPQHLHKWLSDILMQKMVNQWDIGIITFRLMSMAITRQL